MQPATPYTSLPRADPRIRELAQSPSLSHAPPPFAGIHGDPLPMGASRNPRLDGRANPSSRCYFIAFELCHVADQVETTSLSLFEWLKLEDIYAGLCAVRADMNSRRRCVRAQLLVSLTVSRLYLGCISAVSRLYLGCVGLMQPGV